jgi:TolB protein
MVLSKDGNPDLYTMNLRGGGVTRITRTPRVAEASPSWSPDGNKLIYVANATGLPQLYLTGLSGGSKRMTFQGNENIAPDWGTAGIAYSSRREGRYTICVYDPSNGRDSQITTDLSDYEDPSWAPDGRHIAAGRTAGYHSDVYLLDVMGDSPVRLTAQKGEWYSPAWSP